MPYACDEARFLLVLVKFTGPRGSRGSRVRLSCPELSRSGSKSMPYDFHCGDIKRQAEKWLAERRVTVEGATYAKDCPALLVRFTADAVDTLEAALSSKK